jgi:hypothetical protein
MLRSGPSRVKQEINKQIERIEFDGVDSSTSVRWATCGFVILPSAVLKRVLLLAPSLRLHARNRDGWTRPNDQGFVSKSPPDKARPAKPLAEVYRLDLYLIGPLPAEQTAEHFVFVIDEDSDGAQSKSFSFALP